MAGIPNALGVLIGKMIGKITGAPVKADVKGMKAEPAKNEKGAPVGDPGGHLLHGVGYATKDARTQLKNKVEEANVSRFLENPEVKDPAKAKVPETEATTEKRDGEVAERKTDAQETREARDKDVRREDQKDEARMHARHETKEQQEERDRKEGREKERNQEREEHDEEERPGHGWVMSEAEEEEETPRRPGLRSTDEVYADSSRCKGVLDDGTRCLRKPVKGIGYCREHSVNWRPDLLPKA